MKIIVVLLLINFLAAGNVLADDPSPVQVPAATPPPTGTEFSLEQATRQVVSSSAGRVLSAKTEEQEGKKLHVIKILTDDGRIQQQAVDANTGALVDKDVK